MKTASEVAAIELASRLAPPQKVTNRGVPRLELNLAINELVCVPEKLVKATPEVAASEPESVVPVT